MTRKLNVIIAVLAASVMCTLAVLPAFGQSNEPSLGEVARQNRAKAKARKTVTDEDLPPRPMSTAVVTKASSSAAQDDSASAANSSSTPADAKPSDAKPADATAAADAQATPPAKADSEATKPEPESRVAALKRDQENLKQIIEQMQSKIAAETVDSRRQTWNEVLQHAQLELEQKTRELAEAERSGQK